ncbi:hypothetical protein CGLO_11945 [Colletotrichum gloeosporioides Cg-14]|uniref:Uncharacterized protein n=1 Tax=Colletotrichum gloeosporioides (strain Cg-14) TaxID=1237896 RepID=T0K746_COLGC|nr:hypothetical protein CGLO_11945 [Colletotrichum gloeosporioides Cg-14]
MKPSRFSLKKEQIRSWGSSDRYVWKNVQIAKMAERHWMDLTKD